MGGETGIGQLRELLAGLGSSVGQVVSCYVRAKAGATDWSYFLVPFGTTAAPVPVPIFFAGAAAGISIAGAHGTVKASIDPAASATGTVAVTLDVDLTNAPALSNPQLEVVLCTERGILPSSPEPNRLNVAVVGSGGSTSADLVRLIQLKVSLPPTDDHTSQASITATVGLRPGQTSMPVNVALLDGPVTKHDALFGTSVAVAGLPAGLGGALGAVGGTIGGILGGGGGGGGAGLTVYASVQGVYTVDSAGPVSGTRGRLTCKPTVAGGQIVASARVTTPWTPPGRPAVVATSPTTASPPVRYGVAGVRADASETPVSAISAAVRPAAGDAVQLVLPPKPSKGQLTSWQVYRSRLTAGKWGPFVAVGPTKAFGATATDATPHSSDDGVTRAVPSSLTLEWGQPAAVAPAPFPLDVFVESLDAELDLLAPPAGPASKATVQADLPDKLTVELHPGRAPTDATRIVVDAAAPFPLQRVVLDTRRSDFHLTATCPQVPKLLTITSNTAFGSATGGHIGWSASADAHIEASAMLPSPDGLIELPVARVEVPRAFTIAVRTDTPSATLRRTEAAVITDGQPLTAVARVRMPDATNPVLLDAEVTTLAPVLAARLVVPAPGAVNERVELVWAGWSNPPIAGVVPPAKPVIDEAAVPGPTSRMRLRLLDAPPTGTDLTTTPVFSKGVNGRIEAVVLHQRPNKPTLVDANLDGLRRAVVNKAAGADLAVDAAITVDAAVPLRVQIHDEAGPTTIQARARRFGPILGLHVGRTVFGSTSASVVPGSDPLAGLRLWVESGGATTDHQHPVGTHHDDGTRTVSTVVAELVSLAAGTKVAIEPAGPAPAVGAPDGRPTRASVSSADEKHSLSAHVFLATGGPKAAPSAVDVIAELPKAVRLVVGADAGTLAAGSGAGPAQTGFKLIDLDGAFDIGWKQRKVQWSTAAGPAQGTITDVLDPTTMLVAPDPGSGPPGAALGDASTNWYRLIDGPGAAADGTGSSGARLRTGGGPLRARLGLELRPGWGLLGTTATPQVRTDQPDDLVALPAMTSEIDRAKLGAATARIAGLASFDQTSWVGVGEQSRLLASMAPVPAEVTNRPDLLRWSVLVVGFVPDARANRGFAVASHVTVGFPTLNAAVRPLTPGARGRGDLGRNGAKLRLAAIPDQLVLRSAPNITELMNSGPAGPVWPPWSRRSG